MLLANLRRMIARLAVHLGPHELPEFQRAARCLLRTPLLTASSGEDFRIVRRWEPVLRKEFEQKLGYRLDVNRSAARLLRRPASLSSRRGGELESGRSLNRWSYVYLCLTLAAIEQPGHQVLASELVERIEQAARGHDELRIDFNEYAQRRAFRDAVRFLSEHGVLSARDGSVDSLVSDDGQVLFDIDRDAAEMCMVASPSILREVESVEDFVIEQPPATIDGRRRVARHRLNRRMIDQPSVTLADLDDDEVELAWRNRRREAENISRLTGCSIELRREGLALIDHAQHPISGLSFPSHDSISHAALLALDALIDAVAALGGSGAEVDVAADDEHRRVGSIFKRITATAAQNCWTHVVDTYGDRFAKAAREDPETFRAECIDMLDAFGLVTVDADGDHHVAAVAARFRADATIGGTGPDEPDSLF